MILDTSFVPTFVALTSAPGMAAPDASRTDPTIDPPPICDQHSLTSSSDRAVAETITLNGDFIGIPPYSFRPSLVATWPGPMRLRESSCDCSRQRRESHGKKHVCNGVVGCAVFHKR